MKTSGSSSSFLLFAVLLSVLVCCVLLVSGVSPPSAGDDGSSSQQIEFLRKWRAIAESKRFKSSSPNKNSPPPNMEPIVTCQDPPLNQYPYCNPGLSPLARAQDLVSRMELQEKYDQLVTTAEGIPRLGVPEYSYWSEGLHGVVAFGTTSFPEPIGISASFNRSLFFDIASVISTEARALYNSHAYKWPLPVGGLTYFTPNVNIFRDPRWGRGQETPGEDPYQNAQYALNYVKGLQGKNGGPSDPGYLKLVSTCKHYDAYSLENWNGMNRYHFDAVVTPEDLEETYLPAFKACASPIESGGAGSRSVMCSYNSINGIPACAHEYLQQEVLRGDWGFEGYIVSDCDAVSDIQFDHNYTQTIPETLQAALVQGSTDLDCGWPGMYAQMELAIQAGTVTEDDIDTALIRAFSVRFELGMFDPVDMIPWSNFTIENNINTPEAIALAREAAREGVVLLKNDNGLLPLNQATLSSSGKVAVIGPNADVAEVLLGNYHGIPLEVITPLAGIIEKIGSDRVVFAEGCSVKSNYTGGFGEALEAVKDASVAIMFMGIDQHVEAEQLDRYQISLPGVQNQLVQEVLATGVPTVVVLINGGPVAIEWIAENAHAIVEAWYPGERGGEGIADVLFGDYNPGGRLPVTVYLSDYVNMISMENMNMSATTNPYSPGRTYRYYSGDVVYPFGYGLSYSTFSVSWNASYSADYMSLDEASITITATITNEGPYPGSYVVLAFLYQNQSANSTNVPIKQLFNYEKVFLSVNQATEVTFQTSLLDIFLHKRYIKEGTYMIEVGDGNFKWFSIRELHPTTGAKVFFFD
eukprot:TRINITY_DN9396_c0_g1_i1.p1 TRINITY_DN9396_c0_g1~~TRINITY_DN9396_c0_g1_i1.p1  ORF type:complete len:810 (+),score=200.12 TRINITY_DN9396_c0_g1_i1:156-2585(+)